MIFKLFMASAISLAITPNALAQRVDLKEFNAGPLEQLLFTLRVAGSKSGEVPPTPEGLRGLINDFSALRPQSPPERSTEQARRKAVQTGDITKGNATRQYAPFQLPFVADGVGAPCASLPYAPSPRLPREAEQRRAIWYPAMAQAACEVGLPVHLFDALIIQESRYNPVAVSPKGATGLAQLMPSSARILGVRNVWDPRENMRGGARYLRSLLDEFGRYDLALAAYNAGEGRVRATRRVPRIAETIHYVSEILVTMQRQLSQTMASRD